MGITFIFTLNNVVFPFVATVSLLWTVSPYLSPDIFMFHLKFYLMRKNFIYRGMMLLASALTIASCTNDDDIAQGGTRKALDVNVAVQDVAGSRAMVFGQYLAANSEIGVSVVADADGGNLKLAATDSINGGNSLGLLKARCQKTVYHKVSPCNFRFT